MATPFMRYPGGKAKALTFSYDDGITQDRRLVELLNRNGLKGTFNLNSGCFGMYQNEYQQNLTPEEAAGLYTSGGHEVAVHTVSHPFLEKLSDERVLYEILEDRRCLEELCHTVVKGMAYPWGTYSDRIIRLAKAAGIVYSRTIVSTGDFRIPDDWFRLTATCHHGDPRLMELAKQFAGGTPEDQPYDRTPWLFYVWGHSYEFDMARNWNVIEEFASFMAGHADIWYATNLEIYEYMEAYRSLEYSVSGRLVRNLSAMDVYLEWNRKLIRVESGGTAELTEAKTE